ncbi:hypothetical protein BS78_10G003600 [Paspalum vaginatum]|nr:hypothetical protein BS78_10G003600 [Paspalum vaginatum]
MDSDDIDDDFFDKLVNSDDDDDDRSPAAAAAEASAGDLAALTLADQPDAPPPPPTDQHPQPQPEAPEPRRDAQEAAPEKAQQRNDFAGADPYLDHLPTPDGAAAAAAEGQPAQASSPPLDSTNVNAPDHSSEPQSQLPDSIAATASDAAGSTTGHQTADAHFEPTGDPRYLETLYPGWKYDDATQQWYQVDALGDAAPHSTGLGGSDRLQHQSYLQSTSHADTEADNQPAAASLQGGSGNVASATSSQLLDSTATSAAAGYGDQTAGAQFDSTDPRYLESLYPGWKFDESTQQWYQVDTAAALVGSDTLQLQQQDQSTASNAQELALEPLDASSEPQTDNWLNAAAHKEVEAEHEQVLAHPEAATEAGPAELHPELGHEAHETPANTGETAAAPEGGSPGSGKGVHTSIKQVQWNDFGASTSAGGADPFGDLLPDGLAEDDFFGATMPGNQGIEASVVGTKNISAPQHSLSAALDYNATTSSVPADHSFSGGVRTNASSNLDTSASSAGYGDQSTNTQLDSTDPRYWENLYPGWKYDEATLQWYQVDTLSAQSYTADNTSAGAVLGSYDVQQHQQQFSASYLQNSLHASLETIAEESSANTASWGQGGSSAAPIEYPPNMLFYAEYPGWYFDTNTQQWQTLESYQQSVAQAATTSAASDGFAGTGHSAAHYADNSYASSYGQHSQLQTDSLVNKMQPDISGGNSLSGSSYNSNQLAGNHFVQQANAESLQSSANYGPHVDTFAPSTGQYTGSEGNQASYKGFEPFTGNQSWYRGSEHSTGQDVGHKNFESSTGFQTGHKEFQPPKDQAGRMAYEPSTRDVYGSSNGVAKSQDFGPKESMYKAQMHADSTPHTHAPSNYWGTQTSIGFAQQQVTGTNGQSQQFGFSPHEQRSSAGRPPHTVVSFGFGGKLVVLKETSSMTTNFDSGNQGNSGRTVSVLNIQEIVADKIDHSSIANGSALSYFHALCHQPIPGPLVGGSAASKDVNKWLDDMIGVYEYSPTEFQRGDGQKVLISLLKILCQHYGKLRSPFGSDPSHEGIDGPEMAVTKLFSSCKSSANMKGYGAVVHCMRNLPSENQVQATAQEVQNLLVSGRRKEALQYAQEGQLWGPALILALQLGDKFYADTVRKMAHCHFVSGSPLRTLCLLIAGQPADVFNFENPTNSGSLYTPQQPVAAAPKGMLDDWQENLAIITANRTKGDDLVITHLGDCLWKEKNEVASAHSCYLVAELNIDSYSESARMCLIGADHLRCPRTFTSPEAIQRTEVYEYAKVLGNSQCIILPFQPYKLIYAYMLAEVGKVSDSLRYCQASLKVLRVSGRAPELEAWKQLFSTLEERIRTHQQGGYATNLAAGKIVGKIFTSLDKSLSRMMGTQSAPLPQMPHGAANERDVYSPPDTKVVNSQSAMAMSPLVSSVSEQSMSEMAGNSGPVREAAHNRSISEPDFGRTPPQSAGSSKTQSTSGSGGSRFGWLVQKTMGLVSKSHRQAKLGEQNKFYYDEKLKRWVEEGAEVPAEEPPLPPPPTKMSFQNSVPDSNLNGPPVSGSYAANGFVEAKTSNPLEPSPGMPPMPPTQNQFSARGRMGVRSRYVDTFNKGGGGGANSFGAATSYSKPAAPSMSTLSGAKFFVPTPAIIASEQMAESGAHSETTTQQDEPSSSQASEAAFSTLTPAAPMQSTIQRYPSGDNIQRYPSMDNIMTPSGSVSSSMSRSRASSWSGAYPEQQLSSTGVSRSPDGQTMQPPLLPGKRPPHSRSSSNSSVQFNGLGEDLHEVEL